MKKLSLLLVLVLLSSVFAARAKEQAVSVLNATWKTDARGVKHIVGKLKNTTSKRVEFVQVVFDLYDASGSRVGSAYTDDIEDGIPARGTHAFNAVPAGEWKSSGWVVNGDPKSFKVNSITAY